MRLTSILSISIIFLFMVSCFEKPEPGTNPEVKETIPETETALPYDGHFLVNALGDTLPTGVPLPAKGKLIDPDSVAQPRTIPLKGKPKVVPAHRNVDPVGTPRIVEIPENLPVFTPGKDGVPLPKTVPARDKVVPGLQPRPVPALPPKMKEGSIYDIQILDVDQGMLSYNVNFILEDSRGRLWFGTDDGVSRYDGITFTHFTTKEGMSFNNVASIFEDSGGKLWFGTFGGGVTRYDLAPDRGPGGAFTHFTTKEGLSDNTIWSILEDRQGRFWFGTYGEGVSRYDPKANYGQGSFTQFTTNEGLSHNIVTSIFEDSRGYVWLGTRGGGVSRYDPEDNEGRSSFTHFTTNEGLIDTVVWTIFEDSRGSLWIGTLGGVSRYDPEANGGRGTFTNFTTNEGLSHNIVLSILEDQRGKLWFGTGGGASCYDPEANEGRGTFTHFTINEGLNHNLVRCMLEDSHGNLWLGTRGGGVNRYHENGFTHLTTKEGLSHNTVGAFFEDSQGNLWLGTQGGGVSRYDGTNFTHFTTNEGLSHNTVESVFEDSHGKLWFGTFRGGVNRYDPEANRGRGSFTHFNIKEGLTHYLVYSIFEDSQGKLWFGTADTGMSRYDPEANEGQGAFTHFTAKEGMIDNTVGPVLEDSHGKLWFTTRGSGVSRYDPEADNGQGSFTHFTTKEGLGHNYVHFILEDSRGKLWFATGGGGVSRYDPDVREGRGSLPAGKAGFTRFTTKEGLGHNTVTHICEDSQGALWFATEGGGVSRYDPEASKGRGGFTQFTTQDGLSDNNVRAILEDKQKNLWMNTGKGITLAIPLINDSSLAGDSRIINYQFFTFGKEDGLKRQALWGGYLDQSNRIWWGSHEGLTMLDLNNFKLPTDPPRISLDHIEVNQAFVDYRRLSDTSYQNGFSFGKALNRSFDSVAAYYNYPVDLSLPHYLNHLTFYLTAIDWAAPYKIQYSYLMEGLDNTWNPLSSENRADYRNMRPGKYVFKVKAMGAARKWSEPFEYPFIIRPPWWQTWWARTLYVLFGLAAIYVFVQWRTYALKKRQRALEQTVKERTAEVVTKNEELEIKNELITREKERSDELLLNILPSETAEELKQYGSAKAKNYDAVTVLFTDIQGFTMHSERLSAEELVAEIDYCYKAFDRIVEQYRVEKIKTIGDAYMAAAGLPTPNTTNPEDAVNAALAIRDFMIDYKKKLEAEERIPFEVRIGVHTGPVVAGIVGIKKFAYDIWGDTVNLAARMESSGEVGRVNVSQSTYEHLKDFSGFHFIPRGKVKAKNKGEVEMYFVERSS